MKRTITWATSLGSFPRRKPPKSPLRRYPFLEHAFHILWQALSPKFFRYKLHLIGLKQVSNSSKHPTVQPSSKKNSKVLNWQERRKLERERKQREEDERTMASIEAPISESNIGFKLLKQMGYKPGSALGKEGSGRAEPVGLEIRRSRAGIGREDPHKEKRKMEEMWVESKRRKEELMREEFGYRQKEQWRSKRVVVNFHKAKAALDQLENREVLEVEKNEDEEGEQEEEEEEVITEEVCVYTDLPVLFLFGACYCLHFHEQSVIHSCCFMKACGCAFPL